MAADRKVKVTSHTVEGDAGAVLEEVIGRIIGRQPDDASRAAREDMKLAHEVCHQAGHGRWRTALVLAVVLRLRWQADQSGSSLPTDSESYDIGYAIDIDKEEWNEIPDRRTEPTAHPVTPTPGVEPTAGH
jgi:hypothetical protein